VIKMDSYNSIFKHYGIPQEIIDEISLWTHKISFNSTLNQIKVGRGVSTKNKIIVWPHPIFSKVYCSARFAREESNFIYICLCLLNPRSIHFNGPNGELISLSWYLEKCFLLPVRGLRRYKQICTRYDECEAIYHNDDCPFAKPHCCANNFDLEGAPL